MKSHVKSHVKARIIVVAVGAALLLGACGGGGSSDGGEARTAARSGRTHDAGAEATVIARPAALSSLPEVVLLAPAETDAGVAPTFEWEPFEGAAAYRLSVVAPDRPLWSWVGAETSVAFALRTTERSEDAPGLEIEPGSWWSVAALADDGSVLALSPFRSVSPGDAPDELVPPAFAGGAATAAAAEPEDESPATAPGELPDACDIVTPDEVAPVFGEVADHGPAGFAWGEGTDCSWIRINDELNIDLMLQPDHSAYAPEDWVWGEPTPVDGLGNQSFINNDGLSIMIGWTHGENSARISAYAGSEAKLVELAKLIDSRMP